jgi:hypothetical protein
MKNNTTEKYLEPKKTEYFFSRRKINRNYIIKDDKDFPKRNVRT